MTWVQSLTLFSGLRIRHCHELWCRLQMPLGSHVAVAAASSCSSDLTPSMGTYICCKCSQKKPKTNKKTKKNRVESSLFQLANLFCLFVFLFRAALRAYVSRLGVKLELQPLAYATVTVTWEPSHMWKLYHSSLTATPDP